MLPNLNVTADAPATPNKVDVKLSPDGRIKVYNFAGSVNVVLDVVGYYTNSTLQELSQEIGALKAAVASLDAAQPFTVVSPTIAEVEAQTVPTPIRSVTITAPADGQVSAIATGYMFEAADGDYVVCAVMDSATVPSIDGERLLWQSPSGGDAAHLSASRVFDIAAGETTTHYLVCRSATTFIGGTSEIRSPRLTAIFTPAP